MEEDSEGEVKEKRLCPRGLEKELQTSISPSSVPSQYHHFFIPAGRKLLKGWEQHEQIQLGDNYHHLYFIISPSILRSILMRAARNCFWGQSLHWDSLM